MRYQFTIRGMMLVTALFCVCFAALRFNIYIGSFLTLTGFAAMSARAIGLSSEWSALMAALAGGVLGTAVERISEHQFFAPFTIATCFWTVIGLAVGGIVGLVLSAIFPP